MSKIALVIVDHQNDYFPSYPGARWPLEGTEAAAAQAAKLLSTFRQHGLPVVHVRHENLEEAAPFFKPHSEGAQIHHSVAPIDGEAVIVKRYPNSFRETDLKAILDEQQITQIYIAGAMSHMCINAVTRAPTDLGYQCSVAHDACATLQVEFNGIVVPAVQVHSVMMYALAFGYASVKSTDELLVSLIETLNQENKSSSSSSAVSGLVDHSIFSNSSDSEKKTSSSDETVFEADSLTH
mgnify:CR=1 FL=1